MTTWNYRMARDRANDGSIIYDIRQVFYDDDESIDGWSGPVGASGDSWTECANDLALMERAMGSPVLDLTVDPPRFRNALQVKREDRSQR